MTSGQLESKAEKYAYDFHIRQNETGRSKSVYEVYIDGFNDGYDAGFKDCAKKAWHDLRKDPNDLPKRNKEYVVEVTIPVMTHPSYVFATYYFDKKKWFSFGEEIEVIAWCEILTFDKE